MTSISEPNNYETAISDKNWRKAIQSELIVLMKTNTEKLVPLSNHKKAIGCRRVFKLKLHTNGTIEKYKAQLEAKGFAQTDGVNYPDTLNPVVKMTTIRAFMAIATAQHLPLFQLDVNTAFLHGDLNEEVYMQSPTGLDLPHPNMVCKQ